MTLPERPLHLAEWPSVSIIILNFNGLIHLDPCFKSLAQTDYPGPLELILVDNGSTDPSVEHMERYHPAVRLIANTANLGFTGGNNQGAEIATGDYLVFLNNDMRVEPDWLRHLIAPMQPESGLICTGAKILRWDGKAVDFVGGKINFTGHGFQKEFGAPYTAMSYQDVVDLPFACGGAMCIRRDVYREIGGFDPDFFAYFEDVDLGYRLWALGYRVQFAPQAVVYHRHHGTSDRIATHQLRVLYERNALAMIAKNYEQETLDRVLPIALLLTVKRGLLNSRIDPSHFDLGNRHPDAVKEEQTVPRLAYSFFLGMEEFVDQLPNIQEKRRYIQANRTRTDREIFEHFRQRLLDPVFPGMDYLNTQETLVKTLGIPDFFTAAEDVRLLLITHDQVTARMAGPAIRYWEMAKALAPHFHVTLAAHGKPGLKGEGFDVKGYDRAEPETIVHLLNGADVILTFGYLIHELPYLQNMGSKPVIVDIYDPFTLENLEIHGNLPHEKQVELNNLYQDILNRQLQVGDYFICASERQRDYWLGMLAANGRVNPSNYAADKSLRRLIDVVPFGLPGQPPVKSKPVLKGVVPGIGADDKVILWGGGLWEWFDPLSLVQALAQVVQSRPDVKLFFVAKQHRDPTVVPHMAMPDRVEALARDLGLLDTHIFFGDWVPYEERHNYLLEADIGVSFHLDHVETRFAFRTRILDYIWAGLPMVLTEGDIMGEAAAATGVATLVPEQDPDAIAAAILAMLDRGRTLDGFTQLQQTLTWERAVQPLARFLAHPAVAPDKQDDLAGRSLPPRPIQLQAKDGGVLSLPKKVWKALTKDGWGGLMFEARRYIQWRKLMWKKR
ncbi:MAG: glycosyltransferase [Caldilineaceae bacterium]|nr:glycosyltransferase [Caldilineaceae bacterium]MBP8106872.1 glycosyltransferase [Caldilineaceae bacterium]MBP8122438.1 glycosyltransferase [Caldilineaceae bacterium]MBP9072240.1 glycosyltransferase [Caldilineaceae bacterium]